MALSVDSADEVEWSCACGGKTIAPCSFVPSLTALAETAGAGGADFDGVAGLEFNRPFVAPVLLGWLVTLKPYETRYVPLVTGDSCNNLELFLVGLAKGGWKRRPSERSIKGERSLFPQALKSFSAQ